MDSVAMAPMTTLWEAQSLLCLRVLQCRPRMVGRGNQCNSCLCFNSWPFLDHRKTSIRRSLGSIEAVLRIGRIEGLNPILPGREPLYFHLAKGHLFSVPALLLMLVTQHIKGTGIKGNLALARMYHRRDFTRDTSTHLHLDAMNRY